MSPRTKITREGWIQATIGLLQDGRVPADIPITDMAQDLGLTKGSFYARFPGGVDELFGEIIARWQAAGDTAQLARDLQAIRSPRERLRLLRSRLIESARADGAMRRWAARGGKVPGTGTALAAVTRRDSEITALVTTAMLDLGFSPDDAAVAAHTLVYAFIGAYHSQPAVPPAGQGQFEELLAIFSSAASAPGWGAGLDEAAATPGPGPGETVVYPVPPGLTPAERKARQAGAQQFAADDAAADPDASGREGGAPRSRRRAGNGPLS